MVMLCYYGKELSIIIYLDKFFLLTDIEGKCCVSYQLQRYPAQYSEIFHLFHKMVFIPKIHVPYKI